MRYKPFLHDKFHNYFAREFTAHYVWRNAETNLKSTTANGFNFLNNKFINGILLHTLDLA